MAKTNLLSPRFVEHLVSSRIKSDNVFIVSSKWDCLFVFVAPGYELGL